MVKEVEKPFIGIRLILYFWYSLSVIFLSFTIFVLFLGIIGLNRKGGEDWIGGLFYLFLVLPFLIFLTLKAFLIFKGLFYFKNNFRIFAMFSGFIIFLILVIILINTLNFLNLLWIITLIISFLFLFSSSYLFFNKDVKMCFINKNIKNNLSFKKWLLWGIMAAILLAIIEWVLVKINNFMLV